MKEHVEGSSVMDLAEKRSLKIAQKTLSDGHRKLPTGLPGVQKVSQRIRLKLNAKFDG